MKFLTKVLAKQGHDPAKIDKPNSSGQGVHPDHADHPFHTILEKHGYEYSHSTPVTHGKDKRVHHAYKKGSLPRDYLVGVYPNDQGKWVFEAHKGGSGSRYMGNNPDQLDKYLKGLAKRTKK